MQLQITAYGGARVPGEALTLNCSLLVADEDILEDVHVGALPRISTLFCLLLMNALTRQFFRMKLHV